MAPLRDKMKSKQADDSDGTCVRIRDEVHHPAEIFQNVLSNTHTYSCPFRICSQLTTDNYIFSFTFNNLHFNTEVNVLKCELWNHIWDYKVKAFMSKARWTWLVGPPSLSCMYGLSSLRGSVSFSSTIGISHTSATILWRPTETCSYSGISLMRCAISSPFLDGYNDNSVRFL